jgi:hypothetical protein
MDGQRQVDSVNGPQSTNSNPQGGRLSTDFAMRAVVDRDVGQ